jgi:hypothetical protein
VPHRGKLLGLTSDTLGYTDFSPNLETLPYKEENFYPAWKRIRTIN